MKKLLVILSALLMLSCTTGDLVKGGKEIWDNIEISYGPKEGRTAIDSVQVHYEPVYVIVPKEDIIPGQELNYTNGASWLWVYPSDNAFIFEGGALDTVIYFYRKVD